MEKNRRGSFAQEGHEVGATLKCGHEDLNQLLGSQEAEKQRHTGDTGSKSCSEDAHYLKMNMLQRLQATHLPLLCCIVAGVGAAQEDKGHPSVGTSPFSP